MRNLWLRIGAGAGVIFLAGMFVIALGRHAKAQVTDAVQNGGRITVPLALMPFKVDQDRVGSVRTVDVRREVPDGPRRIRIEVQLREARAARSYANCLFQIDAPEHTGLFGCVPEGSGGTEDLVVIGEVRMRPGGLTRPVVITRHRVPEWFRDQ